MTTTSVTESAARLGDPHGDQTVPVLALESWQNAFPGLVAGVTTGGHDGRFDLALWGAGPTVDVMPRWASLTEGAGMGSSVHARQVHEATVRVHRDLSPGIHIAPDADGHLTGSRSILLTVAVADCVPVFLIAPAKGVIGLLHAGWRGVAAGILAVGLKAFRDHHDIESTDLHMHLGPSICGGCYEVGPEVFKAVGEPVPASNTPIDLPSVLIRRACEAGIPAAATSRSTHCTKCGNAGLFSHRAGHAGRQVAFLGFRR